ncbi:phage baseplate assembly protein V [Escherichia coli]|uniref:phage baseplate assembly protein V n=1 Tax=Escherichia coli TaxID=562 RepID=UPI00039C99B5
MNTLANIQELARALRNMIRTGLVVETNLKAGRCRVQTGGMCTDWLQWLTRAGRSRTGGHLPWGTGADSGRGR